MCSFYGHSTRKLSLDLFMSYRQPCSFHPLDSINQLSGQNIQTACASAVLVDFKELTKRQSLLYIGIGFKFRSSLAVSDRIQMLKMHPVRKIRSIVIDQKAVEMLKSLHWNGFFTPCHPKVGRPSSDYVWTHWLS